MNEEQEKKDLLETKEIFAKAGAIITGDHFVYAKKPDGWYHGLDYVNKDAIYPFVNSVSELCRKLARRFWDYSVETVVGPTVGAVVLSQWTAYWLARAFKQDVMAVFADPEEIFEERKIGLQAEMEFNAFGKVRIKGEQIDMERGLASIAFFDKIYSRRVIRRGYDRHVTGKKCLIVEDIINSGETVRMTIDAVKRAGGEVLGVACLCNRSGKKVSAETLIVPELVSLLDLDMKMFKEEECPICREKGKRSVRTDLGKGKEFLDRLAEDFCQRK